MTDALKKALGKFLFSGPNWKRRILVKILRIEPKVYTKEEKEQLNKAMIAKNKEQNKSLDGLDSALLEGLEVKTITLPNASGYLLKKAENPKDKLIYYIHGGGFNGACTRDRMNFVSALVKDFGYNVFSIDYRLAPEFMFPCGLEDCFDGYKWLLESYKAKNILLVGESAGGNLVLALSLLLRDKALALPCAVYANSPVVQFSKITESYEKFSLKKDFIVVKGITENLCGVYFEEKDKENPYVAPYFANLEGLPPIFLSASNCECLRDDSVLMAEKLKKAGNDCTLRLYDGLCHAFIMSPEMKKVVKLAYPHFKEFLNKYLK